MIDKNYTVNFSGLNMSKVSSNDMKWLQSKPWWPESEKAISALAEKYDIEISSVSKNIGVKIPNNISMIEVKAQKLNAKKGLFGSKFGTAWFDIDLYDIYKKADRTLFETAKRAVEDIRFMIFQ